MMTVRAELETRHFVFSAYGTTEANAVALLERAWEFHVGQAKQRGESILYTFAELADSVSTEEVEVGVAYRDHERLPLH